MARPDQLLIAGVRVALTTQTANTSVFKTELNLGFGPASALIARLRGIRLLNGDDKPLYRANQLEDVLYVLTRHNELPESPHQLAALVQAGREEAAAALQASTTAPRHQGGGGDR